MSALKGRVGPWELNWKSVPRGPLGQVRVEVSHAGGPGTGHAKPVQIDVRWKRDEQGIWIELPDGIYGFDFRGERDDEGKLQYEVLKRGTGESWIGLSFSQTGETQA